MYNTQNIGFKLTADGNKQPLVVQNIEVRPFNLTRLDLMKWQNARKSAIAIIPRRVLLYDLYYDISSTDAQVMAVWQKRVDAVTSAEFEFTDSKGNPVDEINELIDCIGFDELCKSIMDSISWGYSAAEPTFFVNDNGQNEFSVYNVPKKHLRPELGIIAKDQLTDEGINIREGIYAKTIMEFGKSDDLGLFLSAAMYAILKRGSISDWAEFIEIYGRGIIDATWDGFDLEQRQKLSKAIQEMGGGGVIIRPAGTTIDIKGNGGNSNGDLQDKFAAKMDDYISKVLLGSTQTTDSSKGSGYAQAKVHQDQDENKNLTDVNYVRRYLNSRFIKVLKAAGFDTKGGTFVLKQKKTINKDAFEIHKTMKLDLKVPIDDDFFYENYGVKRPDNYDQLKKDALDKENTLLAKEEQDKNADTPPAKEDKKGKKPEAGNEDKDIKLSLIDRFLRLFRPAPVLEKSPIAGAHNCGEHLTIKLASFVADKVFEGLKKELIERAWSAKGNFNFDAKLFEYSAKTLTNGFANGWHNEPVKLTDLGYTYSSTDPAILTAYEMNLFRFAGVKTLYEAQQLNEIFRKSKTFKEFYDTASAMLTVHNRDWLETEYNTAMAAGEMAATYSRLLTKTELFPYWEYKTVGDERVRHSHQLLEGIILPWNSPLWAFILPPNDWNCRCFIVPRTKGEVTEEQLKQSEARVRTYLESEAFKKSAKAGWGINRADKGLVFTENQHYTSDYLDGIKRLDKLAFEDYNLETLADIFAQGKGVEIVPKYNEIQKQEAISAFLSGLEKASSKRFILLDFNNRQVNISKATIASHTRDIEKYSTRHQYLEYLDKVLNTPDEVWLNNHASGQLNNYVYIKYYKDKAIAVIARLKDNLTLEIETWFTLDNAKLRRGLLIKN